jgi:hypothetical protein
MELDADRSHLGTPVPTLWRADLAAGLVAPLFDDLGDVLNETLLPDDLCLAPRGHDGHPDHNSRGKAACRVTISTGADMLRYAVWACHWARPDSALGIECRPRKGSRPVAAQKRLFASALASRIRPLGLDHTDRAWLPAPILRPFWRPFEVVGLGGSNK